jgi:hypothetical protein
MLWYFYSNVYSIARAVAQALMVTGGGVRQECPNRLLRAVNLFFVFRNTKKPGCD